MEAALLFGLKGHVYWKIRRLTAMISFPSPLQKEVSERLVRAEREHNSGTFPAVKKSL